MMHSSRVFSSVSCMMTALLIVCALTCIAVESTSSAQEMLLTALQYLRPFPPTWTVETPLEQWGHGVISGGCRYPMAGQYYSLMFHPEAFPVNQTVRLDLLDPSMPMCNISMAPPPPGIAPMHVVVDFTQLPNSLEVLQLPQAELATNSPFGASYVDFTKLPQDIVFIDLSSTGIVGNVDLSNVVPNGKFQETFIINVSLNEDIYGGVDLIMQPLCGMWPGQQPMFLIDLRGTRIVTLIAAPDAQGFSCVANSPNGAPVGFIASVIVDQDVMIKAIDHNNYFVLDDDYYCLQGSGTNLPVLNVAKSSTGDDIIRMMNPPYECTMTLTNRFASFDDGYIFDSTAYGTELYPCLNRTSAFAYKMDVPGPQIGILDSITNETLVFGQCPDHAGQGDVNYFSVSINENAFMDFFSSGFNVTSRGLHSNGTVSHCFFSWHYFVGTGVTPPLFEHIIYNDMQLILDLGACLPKANASGGLFGPWESIRLSQNENHLRFRDDQQNLLSLSRFSYAPIFSNMSYCLVTPTRIYKWNVSQFESVVEVSEPSGNVLRQCSYAGIFQYLTINPQVGGLNTFYAFASVIGALAACLPLNATSGLPRNWSSTNSHLELAQGSTIFGDLILVDVDGSLFTFSASTCLSNPLAASLSFCSSVDLFTGSLILTLNPNRSTSLAYYRRAPDRSLQNVSNCVSNDYPLLFDASGKAFFVHNISEQWAPCFPAQSDTASFRDNITYLGYNEATGVISLISTLENGLTSAVQFTTTSCGAMPIQPPDVVYCPELPSESIDSSIEQSCIAGLCRPMKSINWFPGSTNNGGASWLSGTAAVDAPILVTMLANIQAAGGGTISACYPQCFVDTSQCGQIAFVISRLLMCYIGRGQPLDGATLPHIPEHCLGDTGLTSVLSMAFSYNNGFTPYVGTQCIRGGAAFTTSRTNANSSVFILSVSSGANEYATAIPTASGTSNAEDGLDAECTPCISLWLQKLYPTPLVFIGMNAAFNVLLVIVANYIIEPLVGPRIVKIKVRLLSALGALSRREMHSYEVWLLRCLSPYIASQNEIEYHIDMVCKIVNLERKKILELQSHQSEDGDSCTQDDRTDNGGGLSAFGATTNQLLAPESAQPLTPRGPRRHSSFLANITDETAEQRIESDEKFRKVYAQQLMCGSRMLGSVGEISLRKLVELRDACASRPMSIVRTNYIRFPTQKAKETSFMTELTAENLLLSANDTAEEDYFDDPMGGTSFSNASMATADLQLEDAIAAMDADTTAEWIPYVLAQQWMDRQFLSPKDWLLFLQLLLVLVILGRTFDLALVESGARGSWEVYNAFYFLFLSGSAPVSLVVNAVFRVLYSKQFTGAATGHQTRFASFFASLRHLSRDFFFMVPALLMLPALVSHVIPGLAIFPFLWMIGALFVGITVVIRIDLPEVDELQGKLRTCSLRTIGCIITRVIFRQMVMFVCVASIQLAFSYSMMFYASRNNNSLTVSDGSWIGIVDADFTSRSIVCAMVQVQESAVNSWSLFYSQFI